MRDFKFNENISHNHEDEWNNLFSEDNIKQVFVEKIYPKGGKGVDRISVSLFQRSIDEQAEVISRKCKAGTYKFSPYLEQLISKGKNKKPRVVSIPTIRDKIVLKILTSFLHSRFEDSVAKDLPNTVIRKIKHELTTHDKSLQYIRLDLASFYDSIPHDKLIKIVKDKVDYLPFIKLLSRAIVNPTLTANYSLEQRKGTKNTKGVPQGLSISNILAEIYSSSLDQCIAELSLAYFRFVDDIFILSTDVNVEKIWNSVNRITSDLSLQINEEKSTPQNASWSISEGFEFLGYSFCNEKISVRNDSYNRFLHSIIGKVTKFRHIGEEDQIKGKEKFIEDLNERITGAIDGNKKYGWAFFFSEINDIEALEKIDLVVKRNVDRLSTFSKDDKSAVKRVTRAYYEVKHSPKRGYIHNYNQYATLDGKRIYLDRRGLLKPDSQYTDKQIISMFNQEKTKNLLKLERDVSNIS